MGRWTREIDLFGAVVGQSFKIKLGFGAWTATKGGLSDALLLTMPLIDCFLSQLSKLHSVFASTDHHDRWSGLLFVGFPMA